MKIPLTKIVTKYLEDNRNRLIYKGDIEHLAQENGYYAYTGARTAQKLAQAGKIHKDYNDKGLVTYHV
jgi:hypothetical protein